MGVLPTWACDHLNFRMSFPSALIPQYEEVQRALWDAKSALSALADVLDLWAADVEHILSNAAAANTRDTRNTRRAQPY